MAGTNSLATVTLEVGGLRWASSDAVIDAALGRRPGVVAVQANAHAGTATVSFDPARTSVADWRGGSATAASTAPGRRCPTTCATRWPSRITPPTRAWITPVTPAWTTPAHAGVGPSTTPGTSRWTTPAMQGWITPVTVDLRAWSTAATGPRRRAPATPQEVMGHGGHHAGMSMDDMVADMRNRFLVAAVLSVPILLYSPIGREVLGFTAPAPFGLRDDVFALLLSLPVIFYSAWIFFDGAYRALRARTLDMMVLVAVGVGAGLAVQRRRDPDRRRGGVLRGRHRADRVRAARALVRDARPRRRQRRHPHAAGTRAADGRGAARRDRGRGPHRRGRGR